MEVKILTTLEELESLGSALTMEGLAEDSISEFIDFARISAASVFSIPTVSDVAIN